MGRVITFTKDIRTLLLSCKSQVLRFNPVHGFYNNSVKLFGILFSSAYCLMQFVVTVLGEWLILNISEVDSLTCH
jgi:hypothetical protein